VVFPYTGEVGFEICLGELNLSGDYLLADIPLGIYKLRWVNPNISVLVVDLDPIKGMAWNQ